MILEDQSCSHHQCPKQSEENRGIWPYSSKTEADFDRSADSASRYHLAQKSTFFYLFVDKAGQNERKFLTRLPYDRCTYFPENKLQDINMKIGCSPTLKAANQLQTLTVYFRHVLRNAEKKLLRSNDDCRPRRTKNRRELFHRFPNGKIACRRYCRWFTLNMQGNIIGKKLQRDSVTAKISRVTIINRSFWATEHKFLIMVLNFREWWVDIHKEMQQAKNNSTLYIIFIQMYTT